MQSLTRISVLALILVLTLPSVLLVNSVSAQSKPSIPEFKVEYVDASYDVPTTYSIDSFTGENVTHWGYHVENKSLAIIIKNQPLCFTENDFYYNVRVKSHFSNDWDELYRPADGYPSASNSEYTVINFGWGENYDFFHSYRGFTADSQEDFQVQAMIGGCAPQLPLGEWQFGGVTSDWSPTQTVRFYYPAPVITILCPIEGEFNTSTVPLIFSVDVPVVRMQYILDGVEGQQCANITGNVTLTDVPNGPHNLFVYVWDAYGNNPYAQVSFTVNAPPTPQTSPQQSETAPQTQNYIVPALIVIIPAATVFSFMITRRRKEKSGRESNSF